MTATPEQLRDAVRAIDLDLAQVESDYESLIERLAAGDKNAIRQADALDQKRTVLIRSKAMNLAAAGVLIRQQEAEQSAKAEAEVRRLKIEARKKAEAVCALNQSVDDALAALASLIGERNRAIKALIDSGEGNPDWLGKQLLKAPLTRACCHFGLHRSIDISPCAPTSNAPLSSANKVIGSIGLAGDTPPRRRINGGDT
jgi:hypothetical protein